MNRRIEIYPSAGGPGDWYWRVKAPNGRIVADSGEGYISRAVAITAVLRELRLRKPSRMQGARALVEQDGADVRVLGQWKGGRLVYAQWRVDSAFYELAEVAR